MNRHFGSGPTDIEIWNDVNNFIADKDDLSEKDSDSDEVDSDVEFHLYSQVHYSSAIFSDDDVIPAQREKDEFLDDENADPEQEDVFLLVDEIKEESRESTSGTKIQSSDKEDIARLKEFLSDDEDDFVPEAWEIVDSITDMDSDDAGVDIHVSEKQDEEEVQEEQNPAWIPGKGPKECWKIDDKDKKIKIDGKNRYYASESEVSRMKCRNCNNIGHKARNCPEGKRQQACFMCGGRGHVGRDCEERHNHKFTNRYVECNRCGQNGHMKAECPDLWRQFHITTEPGSINLPQIPIKLNDNIQCYNCAMEGHFGHECDETRHQIYCPILKPLVHRYDQHAVVQVPKDLRKKLKEKRRSQEEQHKHSEVRKHSANVKRQNTHIIFHSPSPSAHTSHNERKKYTGKRKRDFDDDFSSKTKKHHPKRAGFSGRSEKMSNTHKKNSQNFHHHHNSQRFDERVVTVQNDTRQAGPSKKKRKIERKFHHQHDFRERSPQRGFKRRHL